MSTLSELFESHKLLLLVTDIEGSGRPYEGSHRLSIHGGILKGLRKRHVARYNAADLFWALHCGVVDEYRSTTHTCISRHRHDIHRRTNESAPRDFHCSDSPNANSDISGHVVRPFIDAIHFLCFVGDQNNFSANRKRIRVQSEHFPEHCRIPFWNIDNNHRNIEGRKDAQRGDVAQVTNSVNHAHRSYLLVIEPRSQIKDLAIIGDWEAWSSVPARCLQVEDALEYVSGSEADCLPSLVRDDRRTTSDMRNSGFI